MMWTMMTEPAFKGLAYSLLEGTRPQRVTAAQYGNPDVDDESLGSFLERRTGGPDIGDNLVSAVLHGIYAGDINQLSARSLLPSAWYDEAFSKSITQAIVNRLRERRMLEPLNDAQLRAEIQPKLPHPLAMKMATASVYTFKNGIGTLTQALEKSLWANDNVEFQMKNAVKNIVHDTKNNTISVRSPQLPNSSLTS